MIRAFSLLALPLLATTLATASPALTQSTGPRSLLTDMPELPMLSYTTIGRMTAVTPIDVSEIEISSSGDLTDVFIRFFDPAGDELGEWTTLAEGFAMVVAICGYRVMEVESVSPMTTGTLYIPNLTFVQADALRSVWHGRATCSTLPPEVFAIAP